MRKDIRARRGIPDSMPLLSAGRHVSPADGACVMELVSVLAGLRWTDRPRCTHPALAELARVINDRLPDGEQARLAPYAPQLVGLRPKDLRVTPSLVQLCIDAREPAPASGAPRRRARRAARRLQAACGGRHRWWLTVTEPFYRTGSRQAIDDAVLEVARGPHPARELVALFERAVTLCTYLRDSSAAPRQPAPSPQPG